MNWYKDIKVAQLWNRYQENNMSEFSLDVHHFYEMEYKYHMVEKFQMVSNPRRKENILTNIKTQLSTICAKLIPNLTNMFKYWLDGHALTDPVL